MQMQQQAPGALGGASAPGAPDPFASMGGVSAGAPSVYPSPPAAAPAPAPAPAPSAANGTANGIYAGNNPFAFL